ncbi:extracellular solute-binding protein [Catellatospora tritici]|uniref:extracellular solute-binding protein n=1 Tax=Catellatospora tritici TaxID=2851566 RepID=UPI001C2D4A9B|nr:extracellular solute-binding protein [Catellatospora tritici]MBV1849613.1 extracellular solute-binding protein [Catellatospora tritici]
MLEQRPVPRRTVLSGVLTTTAAAIAGPTLLAGCTDGGTTPNTATNNADVKLPTYTPYAGAKPDFPGNADGLLDAFSGYPNPAPQVFTAPPGKGGQVSAFVLTGSPVPPAVDQNPFWQELNKRLNVDLKLTITPSGDMPVKFAALVAGDDLPDFIVPALFTPSGLGAGIANLPAWLSAKCQDLSPYLSGDAAKEYPFLANIPSAAWKQCVYNGGIYGLPVPRGVGGTLMFRRDDLFAQLKANPDPASYAEFRDVCKAVTDPKASRWAATTGALMYFVQQMVGVPNRWRLDGGKLTHAAETEQFRKALSDVVQLVKDGYAHPDSNIANAPVKKWFNAGNTVLNPDRYTAWPQYYAENVAGPTFDIGGMRPPRYDGGGFASTWQSEPTNNFTALKKADAGKIKDLLAIANWLAAPFGTQEWLFRRFGVEGTHYTMSNGGPAQTQAGVTQTVLGIRYIVDAPDAIFIPGNAAATRKSYEYQKSIIPSSVKDPTVGYFSDAWSRKRGALDTILNTYQTDILSGRKPLSAWDDAVKEWRQSGGDEVRGQFQDQLA